MKTSQTYLHMAEATLAVETSFRYDFGWLYTFLYFLAMRMVFAFVEHSEKG